MPRRSGWDQAPTKEELAGFTGGPVAHAVAPSVASSATEETARYARGLVTPRDDDCHLSDHARLRQLDVADLGAVVAGLQVTKK